MRYFLHITLPCTVPGRVETVRLKFDMLLAQEDSAEYEAALSAVHRKFAERLLALCQRNGGIYIKGAQIITSIPAVRPEYRK